MALADPQPVPRTPQSHHTTVVAARLTALALVLLAVAVVVGNAYYRTGEMAVASWLIGLLSGDGVHLSAATQSVYFGLGSDRPFGLRMSPECTSAFLVLPLLLVGAVMVVLRPRIRRGVLWALAAAGLAVVAVNQLRVLTLVGLVEWLGTDRGYYWGHTLLGSMVSVVGGAAALVLFVWLATRTREGR